MIGFTLLLVAGLVSGLMTWRERKRQKYDHRKTGAGLCGLLTTAAAAPKR